MRRYREWPQKARLPFNITAANATANGRARRAWCSSGIFTLRNSELAAPSRASSVSQVVEIHGHTITVDPWSADPEAVEGCAYRFVARSQIQYAGAIVEADGNAAVASG